MQPYVDQYLQTGSQAIMPNGGMQPYDPAMNQQVAPLSADQQQAIGSIQQTAGQVAPFAGNELGMLNDTMSGKYLTPDSNPYLKGAYEAASGRMTDAYALGTAPQLAADAARAGALGGSGYAQESAYDRQGMERQLGDLASQMYGGAYAAERGNQMQAAQMAPGAMQAAFMPAQQALGASTIGQQQQQQVMNANTANAIQQQQYPYATLSNIGQFLGSASGPAGQSYATTPLKTGMMGFK